MSTQRPIEFRGKRIDNGEWIEGDLIHYGNTILIAPSDTSWFDFIGKKLPKSKFQVDPTTLGQFTGLTDKNGAKIWEGDIVRWNAINKNTYNNQVYYLAGSQVCGFRIKNGRYSKMLTRNGIFNAQAEVIGNIHDNPELQIEKQ